MKKIKILLLLLVFSFNTNLFSQNEKKDKKDIIKLSLLIKDTKNKPIPGAIILIDGVKQSRVSNSKGTFKIKLDSTPKTISAFSPIIGIKKIKYKKGQSKITIVITEGKDLVIENNVKKKSLNPQQFATIYDYLRGNVPGINIKGTTITIRGFNSVNGSTTPLFILNGAEVDQYNFGQIIPLEIEKISVLKGSETARYGVRGANGVIIVETK